MYGLFKAIPALLSLSVIALPGAVEAARMGLTRIREAGNFSGLYRKLALIKFAENLGLGCTCSKRNEIERLMKEKRDKYSKFRQYRRNTSLINKFPMGKVAAKTIMTPMSAFSYFNPLKNKYGYKGALKTRTNKERKYIGHGYDFLKNENAANIRQRMSSYARTKGITNNFNNKHIRFLVETNKLMKKIPNGEQGEAFNFYKNQATREFQIPNELFDYVFKKNNNTNRT